ncbi:TatD family hydrolase [Thermoproteota archaeon]
MALLVDVHAHLDDEKFKEDMDSVIDRAREAGVKKIITNGIDAATNRVSLELAKKYDIVDVALGWYPQEHPGELDDELEFIKKQKFVAVGEVGLDYKRDYDKEKQKKDFQKMIDLAKKFDKPLIVHSRQAEEDVIEMLEKAEAKKVVMHCFSGNFKLVKKVADNGWSFSIPVNIVKSDHFQKLVGEVNISQLLTETDAPWLGPDPGKRNEPAFVVETVKKIAEVKNMTVKDVENNIFMNFQNMFM